MALLVRVLRNQAAISQWVPVCSQLCPLCPTQGQWGRTLSGTSQWPQMNQSQTCNGAEKIPGIDVQLSRKYHSPNKLPTIRDFPQPVEEKVGIFTKIIEAMGFTGPLKYSKWKIKIAALRMYTSCVEKTDFEEFFLRCQMPDTFNSWFLITLLHVWMCLVRMKQEGRSGKYMCRIIVHFMWEDVEQRGRIMGTEGVIICCALEPKVSCLPTKTLPVGRKTCWVWPSIAEESSGCENLERMLLSQSQMLHCHEELSACHVQGIDWEYGV
ncbi:ubiquinol-cytochrome c reductase complex assembly factor 1 isoform 2-T2 [Thomomys bottae]